MKLPRHIKFGVISNILGSMYLLAGERELADLHAELSSDLLECGAEMPEEIMQMAVETILAAATDMAPAFRSLADTATATPSAPKQLAQDNDYDRLMRSLTAPGTKGVLS